jgi:hypothetical protein
MDEHTLKTVSQLLLAFQSLSKSIEKAQLGGWAQGTADQAIRNYTTLHNRTAQTLPDDFFISDVLGLDIAPNTSDKTKLGIVAMQTSQMVDYLKGLMRSEARTSGTTTVIDSDELRTMGRDLQDQIMNLTRNTLKRALNNIDVQVQRMPPEPPQPPDFPGAPDAPPPPRRGRIEINFGKDDPPPPPTNDDTPPTV